MNKNGWGLRAELAFVLLFLVCILISTIGLYRLGLLKNASGIYDDDTGYIRNNVNYDYDSLERQVVSAAEKYYNENYSEINDTIVVTTSTLKSKGYLSPLYDYRGKECNGYAVILKTGNIVSYIKCGLYKTSGYSESYE